MKVTILEGAEEIRLVARCLKRGEREREKRKRGRKKERERIIKA